MNILVTGASRGIGKELVLSGLQKNHKVFAVTRNAKSLQALVNDFPGNLIVIEADVTTHSGREKISSVVAIDKRLDILINNAGVLVKTETESDFMSSFQLNSVVPFLMTQKLMPFLKNSQSPKVVHISTMMGSIADNSSGGYYAYRSSKAALNMITKSQTIDHPEIQFSVVHPGWVKTEMGGSNAPVEPKDSAHGIWQVIDGLKSPGQLKFQDYKGKELPW